MQNRDEFDGSDVRSAVGSIFKALDRQGKVEPRRPVWAVAIVLSLLAFLGSVLWYSYPRGAAKEAEMAVPIIRADAGPYKVAPSDPGGMDIPHRDSTVFEMLRAGRETGDEPRRVENLLPEAEEPVSRDKLFAGLKTEIKVEGRTIAKYEAEAEEQEAQPGSVEIAEAKKPEPAPKTAPVERKVAAAIPLPNEKPDLQAAEKASKTEPAAGVETFEGSYFVQLASLKSSKAAESAWQDLTKKLQVLRPYKHRIKKADLGERGVYYRVQAGPMDEAQARQVCVAVEAKRPGGCLVTSD